MKIPGKLCNTSWDFHTAGPQWDRISTVALICHLMERPRGVWHSRKLCELCSRKEILFFCFYPFRRYFGSGEPLTMHMKMVSVMRVSCKRGEMPCSLCHLLRGLVHLCRELVETKWDGEHSESRGQCPSPFSARQAVKSCQNQPGKPNYSSQNSRPRLGGLEMEGVLFV